MDTDLTNYFDLTQVHVFEFVGQGNINDVVYTIPDLTEVWINPLINNKQYIALPNTNDFDGDDNFILQV